MRILGLALGSVTWIGLAAPLFAVTGCGSQSTTTASPGSAATSGGASSSGVSSGNGTSSGLVATGGVSTGQVTTGGTKASGTSATSGGSSSGGTSSGGGVPICAPPCDVGVSCVAGSDGGAGTCECGGGQEPCPDGTGGIT